MYKNACRFIDGKYRIVLFDSMLPISCYNYIVAMPTLRPTAFGSVRGGLEESDSVLSRKQTFTKFAPLLIAFC